MSIHEVLVGTDFSENAEAAVRAAREHAERDGARLHIVHAEWSAEPGSAQRLADLGASLGASMSVVTAGLFGDPANEIVRYAREHGIDLIVVGTHGRTLSRALLGSVAERVIRTAPCPVLAVPIGAIRQQDVETPAVASAIPSRCVVCATPSPAPTPGHHRDVVVLRRLRAWRATRCHRGD